MAIQNRMKRFMFSCLTLSVLLAAAPAFAATATCLCVGITAQSASCGNSVGGNHLKKVYNPSDAIFKKMLHDAAMATFKVQGWALDDSTGWLCWKGSMR